jgi:hypothetical protein
MSGAARALFVNLSPGWTDRYAVAKHRKLFDETPELQ